MAKGDFMFDKPVVVQTRDGSVLDNPVGTTAVMAKCCAGQQPGYVQLIRNDGGTIAIQAMCSKRYLSVLSCGSCAFDADEIGEHQRFRLELVGGDRFILASFAFHNGVECDRWGGLACRRYMCDIGYDKAWMITDVLSSDSSAAESVVANSGDTSNKSSVDAAKGETSPAEKQELQPQLTRKYKRLLVVDPKTGKPADVGTNSSAGHANGENSRVEVDSNAAVQDATREVQESVCSMCSRCSVMASKRREYIMELVKSGEPMDYIDGILTRMYGSTLPPVDDSHLL
ncbi:hypothetical protein PHYBOEH_003343 [Phytophthora boehmeriae]|uniref:Uncharacterized protein n=1 Tax=Phytophthora boehmeriae TaxID=109152 RepID=A0A8T1V2S9_9STRA|nr:hypothetical protein PHYBOEH_003343 [Phytophthora boehmeriae]